MGDENPLQGSHGDGMTDLSQPFERRLDFDDGALVGELFGPRNSNLDRISAREGVAIQSRGASLFLRSPDEAALDRAQAQAQREVRRLAAELEQSLRLAQASLPQVSSGVLALPAQQQALVGALSLPFDIRSLPNGPAAAPENETDP